MPELKMRIRIDDNYWVRMYSAEALLKFGEKGRKELETLLELHPDGEINAIANFVLYEIED